MLLETSTELWKYPAAQNSPPLSASLAMLATLFYPENPLPKVRAREGIPELFCFFRGNFRLSCSFLKVFCTKSPNGASGLTPGMGMFSGSLSATPLAHKPCLGASVSPGTQTKIPTFQEETESGFYIKPLNLEVLASKANC